MVDKKVLNEKKVRLNEEVGGEKTSRVLDLEEAIKIAKDKHLDLICINDKPEIKIVIIDNLEKYNYRLQKANKEKLKKQKASQQPLKEVYITDFTEENDINTKIKQIVKFIDKENAIVKIGIKYRGRERKNMENGQNKLQNIIDRVNTITPISIYKNFEKSSNNIAVTIKRA